MNEVRDLSTAASTKKNLYAYIFTEFWNMSNNHFNSFPAEANSNL